MHRFSVKPRQSVEGHFGVCGANECMLSILTISSSHMYARRPLDSNLLKTFRQHQKHWNDKYFKMKIHLRFAETDFVCDTQHIQVFQCKRRLSHVSLSHRFKSLWHLEHGTWMGKSVDETGAAAPAVFAYFTIYILNIFQTTDGMSAAPNEFINNFSHSRCMCVERLASFGNYLYRFLRRPYACDAM